MSTKKKTADICVEHLDRQTEVSIIQAILDQGDFALEQRDIPLRINGKKKNVICVTKKFLEDMEQRKEQVGLRYNVFTLSKNGRFLNLSRISLKTHERKKESEKHRLNKQIQDMVKNRAK